MTRKTADFPLPTLIVDTREQRPLVFTRLPNRRRKLDFADYSIEGLESEFLVERKSIDDLVGSVTRERARFFRELAAMTPDKTRFARVLVCGPRSAILLKRYHAQHVSPRVVIAAVNVIETRFRIPVAFAASPLEAAERLEDWAYYYAREAAKRTGVIRRGAEGAKPPAGHSPAPASARARPRP